MGKVKVVTQEDLEELLVPVYGSDEWDSYVMGQFKEDELIDGAPLCHGLRRVARNLLGQIVYSGPTSVNPATDPNGPGRATVVYQVTFLWADGTTRVFADVADVWHGNTDDLFCAHPAATASTRAEARALRKALAIKKVSADELTRKDVVALVRGSTGPVKVEAPTTGESLPTDPMTGAQENLIDKLCMKLNINVVGLADSVGSPKKITKNKASEIITKLNKLQQDGLESIPKELVGYDKEWKPK